MPSKPRAVADPLRSGPWIDTYFGIHANTRRRRIASGALPPPDRWIGSPGAERPYWHDSTIRNCGSAEAPTHRHALSGLLNRPPRDGEAG